MEKTIQFSENIVLTKDSHVMGNVLGVVGEINHALINYRGENDLMGDIKLLCNTKGEPKLIGDQNTEGHNINCKNCISKIKKLKSK